MLILGVLHITQMMAKTGKLDTLPLEEVVGLKSNTSFTHYGMLYHKNE